MSGDLYLWLLMLLAVAATYLWRGLGVLLSARIDPQGATFRWVSCVSYAMVAGLISRMTVLPLGGLAETALVDRLLAMGLGFAAFYLARRQTLLGVLAGATAFMALTALRQFG
jgi:branched-subunit amino acid transport protein